MNLKKQIFKILLLSLIFVSCTDNDTSEIDNSKRYEDGFLISAEGNFQAKDGSISYVSNDYSNTSNFIYKSANGAQLGGLIQSVAFNEDKAYVVLNDVNTLVVVDKFTLVKKRVITEGLGNPRYMTVVGDKGYVTNWGDGNDETDDFIAIIDLVLNKFVGTIPVENGPERIVAKGDKLYVSHQGAFGSNNIISVIDTASSNSVSTITVKDNPDEMFFISTGELVVLSQGKPLGYGGPPNYEVTSNTTSAISFIDVTTNSVEREIEFIENTSASLLAYSDNKLYYYMSSTSKVYEIEQNATALATEGVDVGSVYGMNVHEGKLYTLKYAFQDLSQLDVINFTTKANLYSTAVGLGASKIYFTE